MGETLTTDSTAPGGDTLLLQQFLAGRDSACPQCDYNLRDLRGDRCPECGETLVLRVNIAEPRQGLLIAGLVALAAGAGLNGLLLIYMVIQMLRADFPTGGEMRKFFAINAVGLVIEGLVMHRWIRSWRKIRRRPVMTRVLLVVGCCVLTLANILIFSFTIR